MGVLVDDILTRLSSQSVGGTTSSAAWRLVAREFQPGLRGSTQAQQIAVVPTSGFPQEPSDAELDYPTFQVRVRSASTSSTGLEAKVDDVITALNFAAGTFNSRKYVDIRKQGDVLYLGRDDNRRPVYAVNFVTARSRTT